MQQKVSTKEQYKLYRNGKDIIARDSSWHQDCDEQLFSKICEFLTELQFALELAGIIRCHAVQKFSETMGKIINNPDPLHGTAWLLHVLTRNIPYPIGYQNERWTDV